MAKHKSFYLCFCEKGKKIKSYCKQHKANKIMQNTLKNKIQHILVYVAKICAQVLTSL